MAVSCCILDSGVPPLVCHVPDSTDSLRGPRAWQDQGVPWLRGARPGSHPLGPLEQALRECYDIWALSEGGYPPGGGGLSHLQQWQSEEDKGRQYDTSGRFINAMGGNRKASRISSIIKFANN